MAKKKLVYGNGCRGCFLTMIKWPVLLVGTGVVCFIIDVVLQSSFPKMEPTFRMGLAVFSSLTLIRMLAFAVETFLRFATVADEGVGGIVVLERGLRRVENKNRKGG